MPIRSGSSFIETPQATCSETAIAASRAVAAERLGGSDGLTAQGASRAGVTWLREWNEPDPQPDASASKE